MFWSEPPADQGPQAGSALGVVDAGGPSTDGATVLMKDRLCLSTSRMCSIMLDLFLYDCKLRIDRLDPSEEMKRSRNRNNSRLAVTASALALALGVIVFAPIKFESAIGARASLSTASATREECERSAHALRVGTPPLQSMANFPLAFEANAGQADPAVKFLARAGKSELLLTSRAIRVQSRESFGVQFVAANAATTPQGIDILPGQRNYIVGHDPSTL